MKELQLHNIKCILGDCMDYMATIEDGAYDLAIVDPPYGIGVNINMGRRKGDKNSSYKKFYGEDKSIPSKAYFDELFRVSQNQIVWGGNYMTGFLPPSPCWILWDKLFSEDVSFSQFEMAWSSFNSSTKKIEIHPSSIKGRIHPTEKPIKLYKWLLQRYAKQGDKILDTHGGSFSHAIACHNLGFDLTIIEKDEDYFNQATERLKLHQRQLIIF